MICFVLLVSSHEEPGSAAGVCVTGQQCELCGWTTDLLASSVDKTQHGAEQVTGTVISVLICLCVSVCVSVCYRTTV